MHRFILAANIAAIALVPSVADARTQSQATCEEQRSTRVVATIGGAAAGGVLGNVVASRGDKTIGTVVGAAAGAVIANQIAKPVRDCRDAFGYYDDQNRWHATGVNSSDARGYYNREGIWVDGPPNGRYGSDGRWVTYSAASRGEGDYRSGGEWVPASANGYYDRNDIWVPGSASGQYDDRGRWIGNAASAPQNRRDDAYGYYDPAGAWHATSTTRGRATGYYDRDSNWVTGTPNGYYDERRNWIPQREDGSASGSYDGLNRWIPASSAGYYDDNDRWISGAASGHYDQRGRWVAGVSLLTIFGMDDDPTKLERKRIGLSGDVRFRELSPPVARIGGLDRCRADQFVAVEEHDQRKGFLDQAGQDRAIDLPRFADEFDERGFVRRPDLRRFTRAYGHDA